MFILNGKVVVMLIMSSILAFLNSIEEVAFSFNGGKDSTVSLYMF